MSGQVISMKEWEQAKLQAWVGQFAEWVFSSMNDEELDHIIKMLNGEMEKAR